MLKTPSFGEEAPLLLHIMLFQLIKGWKISSSLRLY